MLFFAESSLFYAFFEISNAFINGMSDNIKPIDFLKVLNEHCLIKKSVFKNIHVESNDVI